MLDNEPSDAKEGQATFGMANLRPETTGLPFVVFISQKDSASHASRVKVSMHPRVIREDMSSYGINPFRHRIGKALSSKNEKLLRQWIAINEAVL